MNIYKNLNQKQKQAVDTIDGPLLVLAGPGTGKTQLLSARVMRILELTDTPASAILCLTFTENGAQNMENRLAQFIGKQAYEVNINTYHGFSQTIISQFPEYFRNHNLDKVADDISKYQFIQEIQEEMLPNNVLKKVDPRSLIATISELKRGLIDSNILRELAETNKQDLEKFNPKLNEIMSGIKRLPSNYQKSAELFQQILNVLIELDQPTKSRIKPIFKKTKIELEKAFKEADDLQKSKPLSNWKTKFLAKDKDDNWKYKENQIYYWTLELANLFEKYNQIMSNHGLYDFDDMILKTIEVIEAQPELKFNLQEKYLYILLDEYQDTNAAQSRLIELITDNPVHEGRPNVMAVGDDDQAIYAFQGAEYSNMINFYNRYRETKIINLTENYRSHQSILDFAENIAKQINSRLQDSLTDKKISKKITASNPKIIQKPVKINRYDFVTPADQNKYLAETIKNLIDSGVNPEEIAILAPKHKYLEATTPFLAELKIPIRYEKKENILENSGTKAIITLTKIIDKLSRQQDANSLIFELLSYDFWGLKTYDVWKISWKVERGQSYLEVMLDYSPKTRKIALWLMELSSIVKNLSLESCFDYLIGNIELTIKDKEEEYQFKSPLREFFLNQSPEKTLNFVLDINVLRSRLLDFTNNHPSEKQNAVQQLINMINTYESVDLPINRTNPYSESNQAVNLMTAFASKGLEFEHVFLLETNKSGWASGSGNQNRVSLPDNLKLIRHQKSDTDEQLRLLFVAITRAKSNLYLLNPTNNFNNKPTKRLDFLEEIEQNEQVFAKSLPENHQQVIEVDEKPSIKTLENNIFDNFTDWRTRHIDSRLEYKDLLQPKIENLRLSPTGFNNYLDIIYSGPEDFFIKNILKFPGEYDIRMNYGTMIHSSLEQIQLAYNDSRIISPEKSIDYFKQRLSEYNLTKKDEKVLLKRAEKSLPKYVETRQEIFKTNDNYQVITELNCSSRNIVIGDARLTGTIDRLEINKKDKTISIVDYKTGNPHTKFSMNNNSLRNYGHQLYYYKLMVESLPEYANYRVNKWRLEFVAVDTENKIHYLEGDFEDKESEVIKKLINAVWHSIKNFEFKTPDFPDTIKGRKDFEQYLLEKYK